MADQLRGYYSTKLRTRKWWHSFFFWALDTAICNAYLCYCDEWGSQTQLAGMKALTHFEFRETLAQQLTQHRLVSPSKKQKQDLANTAVRQGALSKTATHRMGELPRNKNKWIMLRDSLPSKELRSKGHQWISHQIQVQIPVRRMRRCSAPTMSRRIPCTINKNFF